MITCTRATEAHLPLLAPLFDGYRVFYRQASDLEGANTFLGQRLAQQDSVILLAMDGNEAAGFTQLYPSFTSVGMKRVWILNDLFVHPGHRRKGVARLLLEEAANHARETGAKGLLLETEPSNTKAQALYEKMGWVREQNYFYTFVTEPS